MFYILTWNKRHFQIICIKVPHILNDVTLLLRALAALSLDFSSLGTNLSFYQWLSIRLASNVSLYFDCYLGH